MNYQETIKFLYAALPSFQNKGKDALNYKLENIKELCNRLNNPHKAFKSFHIAGTNGKGSSSHFIASILQESGFKVGLYTSPHLKDFRERFRINGQMVSKEWIISFVHNNLSLIEEMRPSFFEITVLMAFKLFEEEKVDYAVIEVGLGGRLDSTNIIEPLACLITNIGYDHMDVLGSTLKEIAFEKAGIIKYKTPVCISEFNMATKAVFIDKAKDNDAPIYFSDKYFEVKQDIQTTNFLVYNKVNKSYSNIESGLKGKYQAKNIQGVKAFFKMLSEEDIFETSQLNILAGIKNVINNTNLKGRWQKLSTEPECICDTGHNEDAFNYLIEFLNIQRYRHVFLILGFSKDKVIDKLLLNLPRTCSLFLCSFEGERAKNPREIPISRNQNVKYFNNVNEAKKFAFKIAHPKEDFIFIGGSTYLVAELDDL